MKSKLWERIVIWRYVSTGLRYGDYLSYMNTGLVTDSYYGRIFARWEKRYIVLGYKPLHIDDWLLAGGYGYSYKDKLKQINYDD